MHSITLEKFLLREHKTMTKYGLRQEWKPFLEKEYKLYLRHKKDTNKEPLSLEDWLKTPVDVVTA